MTTLIAYPPNSSFTTYTVPSSVTRIASNSIRQVNNLQYLILQNGVTTIEDYAIQSNNALLSIMIPISVTSIGNSALYGCMSLTIYASTTEKPTGWNSNWNSSARPIVWGYTG
jgi:hypothetical protein